VKKQQLSNSYFFYYKNYNYPIDSILNLANKCPYTNGKIVYAARNLYNVITNRINQFEDNCNTGLGRGMKKGMAKATENTITKAEPQFILYPNPAGKTVNMISSTKINKVDIIDLMGRVVYTQANVNNITAQLLNLQLQGGVYIVKALLVDNTTITKKLIIE
jgi:hypothetical protein